MSECWCCDRSGAVTPRTIFNRPALSALRYRAGTFSSFRKAMIEAIATQPPLAGWTARESDDFGIQIVELWAYLGDVLTFYQERLANEAFLRTSTERDSLMRLANLIDYTLRPGVSATAYLAFTMEKNRQVQAPAGLRVQSKPGPGQQPATFESEAALDASAAINRFRVWPAPTADLDNFRAGADRVILLDNAAGLKVGQALVFVGDNRFEAKKIVELQTTDRGPQLTWTPPNRAGFAHAAAYRLDRQFRLFGQNAPATFLKATVETKDGGQVVKLEQGNTPLSLGGGLTLDLDGAVSELKVGSLVLVTVHGDDQAHNFCDVFKITGLAQLAATVGPLTGTATRLDLEPAGAAPTVPAIADLRKVQVLELTSQEIAFSRRNFGAGTARLPVGTFRVYSDRVLLADLRVGGAAIVADDSGKAQQVTITGVSELTAPAFERGVVIEFTPVLADEYSGETAVMYGNVVKATHGETVKDETLGSGDGAQPSQSFALKKSPVTFTPDKAAPHGLLNSLTVSVDGVKWREAPNFFGLGPDDRVYAPTMDEKGVMRVQFGDGVTGARLPTGANNVRARYRKGSGSAGSAAAGALTTLLDAKPGIKSVTNPAASFGWADPESLAQARRNAPTTVLTFDRAVSLADFENLARSYPGVGKARAALAWNAEQQIVRLTCAASDGKSIAPLRADLLAFMDVRRDPNRELDIVDFKPAPIKLHAYVVADPAYDEAVVLANAQAAVGSGQLADASLTSGPVYGFFAFDRLDLDEDIHLSEVYAALQGAPGVVAVEIVELHRKDDSAHILQSIAPIGPSEVAAIEAPEDVTVELKGAL